MSIDISQFHDVFFKESFAGLDAMERGLLKLDVGAADIDAINIIFKVAHSIRGGAATFGFMGVSKFAYVIETMFDEMRNGQGEASVESTNLLLDAVDVLREMLTAVQQKMETDDDRIADIRQKLEAMMADNDELQADAEVTQANGKQSIRESDISNIGWIIEFSPHRHLFQTGNDPVRMFRELDSLGELTIEVIDDKLPPFTDLDPEDCYLKWILTLRGNVAESEVVEIFEWVDDDCDLVITPLSHDTVKPAIIGEQIPVTSALQEVIADAGQLEVADAMMLTLLPTEITSNTTEQATKEKSTPAKAAASIRVGTDKVDSLLNMVGELVITQSMLSQIGENFTPEMLPLLIDGLAQLERNTREMQEGIIRTRMLPISFAFNRFPRLVHDMTDKMGKKVELKLTGEQTELDKTVMEKISDPLVHLVRNSLEHGLETPEARVAAGKDETGTLQLKVFHQGGNIVIEIHDDGAGLNEEKILSKAIEKGLVSEGEMLSPEKIHELIFLPGFSTADMVTDISGRGMGMGVVRKNISSLGGTVDVFSKRGEGSIFTLCLPRLPLTSAIMDGQTIRVADENYIIPLISIIETVEIKAVDVKRVLGKGELYKLGDEYVPVIRLYDVFNLTPKITVLEEGLLVIVEGEGQKNGLFIEHSKH